jgi:ABC-type multidrug transport system fused ATPase/permease subunit
MLKAFRVIHRLGHIQVEQSRAASSLFLDALNGLRTVRAYGAEEFVDASYRYQLRDYIRTLLTIDIVSLLTRLVPGVLLFVGAAIYIFQTPNTMGGSAEFAFIVTAVLLLMRFFPVVGQTVGIAQSVIADARAGRDVTELVGKRQSYTRPVMTEEDLRVSEVDMRGVGFSYRPDNPILHGVNLRLQSGMSYAFIGRSGSGKSTVMDLLLRFYEPETGVILIDGVNTSDIDDWQVRQRILLVAQETTVFNDTVGNNIRFGIRASDADVMNACKIACIDDLIDDLSNGLDTMLDYRGTNLSGGQRQRIGLARALLRHAPVLLLDESTSALDAETRSRVVANLKHAYKDKILVFVTHDANIIQSVDEVIDISQINQHYSRSKAETDA